MPKFVQTKTSLCYHSDKLLYPSRHEHLLGALLLSFTLLPALDTDIAVVSRMIAYLLALCNSCKQAHSPPRRPIAGRLQNNTYQSSPPSFTKLRSSPTYRRKPPTGVSPPNPARYTVLPGCWNGRWPAGMSASKLPSKLPTKKP